MRLQSVEMISRFTSHSSRLLIILSTGVALIEWYDLNTEPWKFLDRQILAGEFKEIATIVLFFALVSHLINWMSDREAYARWFQTNNLPTDSIDAIGSFRNQNLPMINGLQQRLLRTEKHISDALERAGKLSSNFELADFQDASDQKTIKLAIEKIERMEKLQKEISDKVNRVESSLKEVSDVLEDIGPGFKRLSLVAFSVIYGWCLALPVSTFLCALVLMWCK